MAADQDWCLECGSAQPGRLGRKHGWRAALTVVALTGVLATGAVAASYAALSSDAQRSASAPPPPGAAPTVTQPPVQVAPPAETTPKVPAPSSDAGDDLPDAPSGGGGGGGSDLPSTPAPATPSGGSVGGSYGGSSGGSSGGGSSAPAHTPIALAGDAANVLGTKERIRATQPNNPKRAIDGDESTHWRVKAENGEVGVGLVVSLDEARDLYAARVATGTPGFTMTLYGAKSKDIPPDTIDTRWVRLKTTKDFGPEETLKIDGSYRHVLLWIEEQPADLNVFITEVDLLD
jgi:uncharacterized protein (DUF736 family)